MTQVIANMGKLISPISNIDVRIKNTPKHLRRDTYN